MTKFRLDINALRALAVGAVVAYHYNLGFARGGFVGVDIFFVLSGYLMTEIIVTRINSNSFDVLQFYFDRAKRIVPGLLGLCAALLVFGYFYIDPVRYNTLGYTSLAAILFYSNALFAHSQGYFSPDYNTKLLIHTWSLSVEWQFYLVYPILLMGLHRLFAADRYVAAALAVIATVSLALCIYYSGADQPTAFYLLPQRAWEMAAGGIVALRFKAQTPRNPALILSAGFLLIGISIFLFDRNMSWPSYWAVAPVAGTCLVLIANQEPGWLLRGGAVQSVGRWSYSIYLWHWPIAVMFVYFGSTRPSGMLALCQLAVLAAIIAIGALLLRAAGWVSGHVDWPPLARRPAWTAAALAASLVVTAACALSVNLYRGFDDRTPEIAKEVAVYKAATTDWDFPQDCDGVDSAGNLRPCHLGRSDGPETLILGDSFSKQIYQRLEEATNLTGSFTFLTSSACPAVTGFRYITDRFRCNGLLEKAFAYAAQRNPRRIVLMSNWFAYFNTGNGEICFIDGESCVKRLNDAKWLAARVETMFAGLRETLRKFRHRGTEVVIILATPYGSLNVPAELLKRRFLGMDTREIAYFDRALFEKESALVNRNLVDLAVAIGASVFEPADYLCDENQCPTLDSDGAPYFKDTRHYRAAAVRSGRFSFFDAAVGLDQQYGMLLTP